MGAAGAGRRTGGTQLTPILSLDALGASLASAYDGLMVEAVPERRGAVLRRVGESGASGLDDARAPRPGPGG